MDFETTNTNLFKVSREAERTNENNILGFGVNPSSAMPEDSNIDSTIRKVKY